MFRPIRRKKNEISLPAAQQLLREARRGVLAVNGDDGYPYAIPINYLYDEASQKLYFHGAKVGHKVDALKACDKVCFTVYGNETIKDEPWAPYWQSVVVFGRCHLKALDAQALETLRRFALKYCFGGGRDRAVRPGRAMVRDHDRTPQRERDSGTVMRPPLALGKAVY